MRDYKNIKVPKKYRTAANRARVKRVEVSRGSGRAGRGAAGLKSLLVKILVFALIAGSGWLGWQGYQVITHAGIFQVSGVDVKGVRQLNDADLKNIVSAFTGQNIFRVDIDAAVRRARANPWVEEVRIYRRLPNRISMVFVERVPYAILDTGAGRYLMDNDAVVIDRLGKDGASAWPLPVIVIKDYRPHTGEPVTSEGMAETLTLLAEIAGRGGWELADLTVRANSPESLSVVYAGHEFKIGSGNYAEKLRRLGEIMEDVKQRGLNIAYVDLRPERQAAVMVVKNSGSGPAEKSKSKVPSGRHQIPNKHQ